MLYQLGSLAVKVAPFNVDKVQYDGTTDYVAKPVVGAEPPMEYVGEGANTWRLSGKLFPKVIGGMDELGILHSMRQSGSPQFFQRGDGVPMGWVVIENVSERSTHLAADGVGQQIEVDIQLRRAGKPSQLSLFSVLVGIFL